MGSNKGRGKKKNEESQAAKTNDYGADKIQVLKGIEAVRRRRLPEDLLGVSIT